MKNIVMVRNMNGTNMENFGASHNVLITTKFGIIAFNCNAQTPHEVPIFAGLSRTLEKYVLLSIC